MQIITKLKFESNIFKSSNKCIFYVLFLKKFFHIHKNENIKRIKKDCKKKKKLVKDIKIFIKMKKMDVTKISLKKTLVEYRKKTLSKEKKYFFITTRKYCILENFASLLGKV